MTRVCNSSPVASTILIKPESADLLYLGGWAEAQLPKMRLNAKEIEIEATTTVSGKVNAEGLALTGGLTMTGDQDANNVIELGYGVTKEVIPGRSDTGYFPTASTSSGRPPV